MAKALLALLGAAGLAGSAYAYWQDLGQLFPQSSTSTSSSESTPESTKAKEKNKTDAVVQSGSVAPAAKKGAGSPPVTVATAQLSDMPLILSAPGTVEALATVAIKPRVDGQIVEVGFKEGDMVEAGAMLYRLDDRLVRAQIKQAEAAITRDQAALKDAMAILGRRDELFQKRIASEAATETARQQVEVLKATIASGQAQLEMQRTQLDYLTIRAPITGRTGSMTAKLGSFIRSADAIALVTINQTKPITVAFALPQASLQLLKAALDNSSQAVVLVPGAKSASVRGTMNFVDNQVDKTTGTVTAKVLVENADELLWPGQAVAIELTVETRANVVSVPASAVLPAQQGMITWVVTNDNKVSVRPVVQERVIGQTAFIASGLNVGERVVTDGQLRLAPGATVSIRDVPTRPGAPTSAGATSNPNPKSNAAGNASGG